MQDIEYILKYYDLFSKTELFTDGENWIYINIVHSYPFFSSAWFKEKTFLRGSNPQKGLLHYILCYYE